MLISQHAILNIFRAVNYISIITTIIIFLSRADFLVTLFLESLLDCVIVNDKISVAAQEIL